MLSIHSSPLGPLGTRNTGGMSVYVRELAKWLGQWGHHVDIFTYTGPETRTLKLHPNVRLIHLAPEGGREIAKEQLPLHLHTVFEALESYRSSHSLVYDLIHSHYWLSGVVGAMAQSHWHCAHLIMFHTLGMIKNNTASGENESDHRIAHERRLVQVADAVVVPAVRERDNLVNYYSADPQKIRIIPCGVNLDLFKPMDPRVARQALQLPVDRHVALYVGRFAPLKGIDALLGAVADLRQSWPHLHLLLVGGDGPQAASTRALVRLVEILGIRDRVTLAGCVDQTALPQYYNASDLLVMPSHYESFGLVMLEALACGTPVVATPVGAVESVIRPDINGMIVDRSSRGRIAHGMSRVLTIPPGGRPTRHKVRSTVDHLGWDRMAGAVLQTYGGLHKTHSTEPLLPADAGVACPN